MSCIHRFFLVFLILRAAVGPIDVHASPNAVIKQYAMDTQSDIRISTDDHLRSLADRGAVRKYSENRRFEVAKVEQNLPVAQLPSLVFEFQPVVDGTVILHEFVIRNTGNALLRIPQILTG